MYLPSKVYAQFSPDLVPLIFDFLEMAFYELRTINSAAASKT
ncbi:hypothetical protein B932_2666 [Gluconobacter oxydans H24]|nr:hypothetical protein B932_2666 [Gluconobacter oxydans H24]